MLLNTLALAALASTSQALVSPRVAEPSTSSSIGQTIPILKRSVGPKDDAWFEREREWLRSKYNSPNAHERRASGTNLIVNHNADSSYYGSIAIGTPPVSYNLILDTASSDMWVAGSSCVTGCSNVPRFNPSQSSTFVNRSVPFSIRYGGGSASGSLGSDTVQMAGFTVTNQTFALASSVSANLLDSPVSGLFGLAWSSLSSSGATPFWEALVKSGSWDQPVMAFQLTRFLNDTNAQALEPGGSFTMGFVNSSLYTGDIEYLNVPSGSEAYWTLPVTAITVNGNSVSQGSGTQYAAIDTGTTLVGGPADVIASIYAQIPNSQAGTGSQSSYWYYPCSTAVTITMSFGGKAWSIDPQDFLLQELNGGMCVGAFFEVATGSGTPAWIVGDTFLKNVYSVFRYSPASIGFASLSSTSIAMNGFNGPVPSATIGSAAPAISATNSIFTGSATSILANPRGDLISAVAAAFVGGMALYFA